MHTVDCTVADRLAPRVVAECWSGGGQPEALHEVRDTGKVAALMDDMRERGWQGPPVVVDGAHAVTGSHRIQACATLLAQDCVDIEMAVIELVDVCAAYGVDWTAHLEQSCNWTEAVCTIDALLPREVVDYLGLDVH